MTLESCVFKILTSFLRVPMRIILAIFILLSSQLTSAATQGDLSQNSSGEIEISLTLGLLARLSGLTDIVFGAWNNGDLTAEQNICVGLYGTNQFRFRASGSGDNSSANAFALTNGSTYLSYRVFFNDQTGTSGRNELSAGTALNGQTAGFAFWNIFGCLVNNANVSILIEESALNSAQAGSYTGTLTLTVVPE